MVLGRDWLDAWSSGADVGHKVVAQNLADVAAMGGRPTGVLVTLVTDPMVSVEWVVDLGRGVAEACDGAGVVVLGGDLSSAPPGVVMVSVTALGELVGAPVLRSGARDGDRLAVCGSLGLAAAGLQLLQQDQPSGIRPPLPPSGGPRRHLKPAPRPRRQERAPCSTSRTDCCATGVGSPGPAVSSSSSIPRRWRLTSLRWPAPSAEAVGLRPGREEHSLLATFPGEVPEGWRVIGSVRGLRVDEAPGSTSRGIARGTPAGTTSRMAKAGVLGSRPCVRSGQRATLPALRHEVQTLIRFGVTPSTSVRTRWMLGFQRRLVRRCECEML